MQALITKFDEVEDEAPTNGNRRSGNSATHHRGGNGVNGGRRGKEEEDEDDDEDEYDEQEDDEPLELPNRGHSRSQGHAHRRYHD